MTAPKSVYEAARRVAQICDHLPIGEAAAEAVTDDLYAGHACVDCIADALVSAATEARLEAMQAMHTVGGRFEFDGHAETAVEVLAKLNRAKGA